jgi:hypothetical protein
MEELSANIGRSITFYSHHPSDGISARCLANTRISQALHSQSTTEHLESRTLIVTTQISDLALGRVIGSRIFGSIRNAIVGSSLCHLANISLITCPDVLGTRSYDGFLHKANHPHIHSITILPSTPSEAEVDQLKTIIIHAISSIDGVIKSPRKSSEDKCRDPIHVSAYEPTAIYWAMVDYMTKAEKKCLGLFDVKADVYPYRYAESHLKNKPKREWELRSLQQSVDRIYSRIHLHPEEFYQLPMHIGLCDVASGFISKIASQENPLIRDIIERRAVKEIEKQPVTLNQYNASIAADALQH